MNDINDTLEEELRLMLVEKNNECNYLRARVKLLEETVAQEQEEKYRALVRAALYLSNNPKMAYLNK